MTPNGDEPTIVVFDVNVYLDIARLLGAPFSWELLREKAADVSAYAVPCVEDERIDSLRAVAYAARGYVLPSEPLEVWSSDHIDDMVFWKATQPEMGPTPEDRGLGWSDKDAEGLLERLVRDLAYEHTNGNCIEITTPHDWSAVSHEDGQVYQTAYKAGDFDASVRICVTRDYDFRQAAPYLSARVDVMYPWEFVRYLQRASTPPPGSHPVTLMRRDRDI